MLLDPFISVFWERYEIAGSSLKNQTVKNRVKKIILVQISDAFQAECLKLSPLKFLIHVK